MMTKKTDAVDVLPWGLEELEQLEAVPVAALLRALYAQENSLRAKALCALEVLWMRFEERDTTLVSAVLERLADDDDSVRALACGVVGYTHADVVVPALLDALQRETHPRCLYGLMVSLFNLGLGWRGRARREAKAAVERYLHHPDPAVSSMARWARRSFDLRRPRGARVFRLKVETGGS